MLEFLLVIFLCWLMCSLIVLLGLNLSEHDRRIEKSKHVQKVIHFLKSKGVIK